MAESAPPEAFERPSKPTRSSTWFNMQKPAQTSFKAPTRTATTPIPPAPVPVKTRSTWSIKDRVPGIGRSSSWSITGPKRVGSDASQTDQTGISQVAEAQYASKVIKNIIIEELGARAGETTFGPTSLFSGMVITNARTDVESASITVTFQGISLTKGFAATFINVSQKLWQGSLKSGGKRVSFAFRFPRINLPPSSSKPSIKYLFSTTLRFGDEEKYQIRSTPVEVKFCPSIDPFLLEPSNKSTHSTFDDSESSLSKTEKASCKENGNGPLLAEVEANLPTHSYLPGDEIQLDLKMSIPKNRDVPKFLTLRVEECRKLVIDSSNGSLEFRGSEEVVRSIKSEIIPLAWNKGSSKGQTTDGSHKEASSRKDVLSQGVSQLAVGDASGRNTIVINNENFTILQQAVKVKLPEYEAFINQGYLPSASLPLNGHHVTTADDLRSPPTPINKGTPETVPLERAHNGMGMRMIVTHKMHLVIQLAPGRIISKKSTLTLQFNILLGNRDPKESRRVQPLPPSIISSPSVTTTKKRSASASTNISFVLTTADDANEQDDDAFSSVTIDSDDKGKTPVYKLGRRKSNSDDNGNGDKLIETEGLSSGYAMGATLCEMPESPLWMDVKSPQEEKEEKTAYKTLAETKDRPYFFRYDFEDPFPI